MGNGKLVSGYGIARLGHGKFGVNIGEYSIIGLFIIGEACTNRQSEETPSQKDSLQTCRPVSISFMNFFSFL